MTATPSADALLAAMEAVDPRIKVVMQTLEEMATQAAVGMELWDRHSNACLTLCAALRASQEREAQAVAFFNEMADMLEGWADESLRGGWATHQVQRNRDAAKICRIAAIRARKDAAP